MQYDNQPAPAELTELGVASIETQGFEPVSAPELSTFWRGIGISDDD